MEEKDTNSELFINISVKNVKFAKKVYNVEHLWPAFNESYVVVCGGLNFSSLYHFNKSGSLLFETRIADIRQRKDLIGMLTPRIVLILLQRDLYEKKYSLKKNKKLFK